MYLVLRKNLDGSHSYPQKPKVHNDYGSAVAEAERLAQNEINASFFIFKAVAFSARAPTPVQTLRLPDERLPAKTEQPLQAELS